MPHPNHDTPWASFCLSTYRRPAFLREALTRFGAQAFTNFEVVISDNDPDASAEAVVAEFADARFRYFHNGDNLGMIKSFNKSIERSRGEFIVVITDDDPVYPDMLTVLHQLHIEFPGYGLYFGGHDTVFTGLLQAKMAKARVGTNSGLADWNLDEKKVFPAAGFLQAFLDGTIGGSLLWSVGVMRRDLALAIGGIPDFGTPHLADCSYLLLGGAREGCVYVNRALGCRVIHDANYSYSEANYESIYKAPQAFYDWTTARLPAGMNTPPLQQLMAHFVGRDMVIVVIAIKKMLRMQQVSSEKFEDFRRRFFQLPFLKKWKRKYYIAVHFPRLFELFLAFRNLLAPPAIDKFSSR